VNKSKEISPLKIVQKVTSSQTQQPSLVGLLSKIHIKGFKVEKLVV
jgi:hypothetical protein